ncbi:hypothetical protein IIE18_11265 [Pseudomonas sp. V1]|uniref:hypothetical protein n=1 Tax=Pseudomonas arcuscaelestis TaxID=2710591 RepID=UPI00193FF49E|nr:hypothetical protein [Pseudomonas arcuscaelestis]MBM3105720.1 hypothetical protein [Pseudomonas arcuscaelestis]
MKLKLSGVAGSTLGFSKLMLFVIGAIAVGVVQISMTLSEGRKLPRDFHQIDAAIEESKSEVQRFSELDRLPRLERSWKTLSAALELNGIKLEAFDHNNSSEMGSTYSGPLKGWPGQMSGNPQVVLSSVRELQQVIPIYLYDYSIADGVMKLNFVVVGT